MSQKVVLITNLGSPDSTSVKDVRKYLKEFLMDGKVIDIPRWIRKFLVKGIIVPFRAPKSAEKYRTIWTKEGSPLVVTTQKLAESLQKELKRPTYFCMRYANPSPQDVLAQIHLDHPEITDVILFPLYPHYAMSSFETAVEHVIKSHSLGNYASKIQVIPPFYQHPAYIVALSDSIRPYLNEPFDHLLFSYHGIPERHVKKTDPTLKHCLTETDCCSKNCVSHAFCYRHQIIRTTEFVAENLGLPREKVSFSFQSRLGSDRWLKPYTAQQLKEMPKKGIKNLLIACPAFVSDCLETLEEIHLEGKETFLEAGGSKFTPIPCLNLNEKWVNSMVTIINEQDS